jgi:restriction system protein
MAIPDYQTLMLPLLEKLGNRQEYSLRQIIDSLAVRFKLTPEEKNELLPSGQLIFNSRTGWARTYLKKSCLIETTKRGFFRISDRGSEVLKQKPGKIDVKFLDQFPEFKEFRAIRREKTENESDIREEELKATPEESLANAYQRLRNEIADDLINQLKASSPNKFENIVVDLLLAMGYGGSRKDAAQAIGKTGDEGVDGIINEDRLGLDVIYVQAKRWEGTVGRPEIQKFAGALQGQRAKKGIFITTSDFSKEAIDFTSRIENKIVLIDGHALVQFMIDRNVGVTTSATYEIKKIDMDYFIEE